MRESVQVQAPSGVVHRLLCDASGRPYALTDCGRSTWPATTEKAWPLTEQPVTCGRCVTIQAQRQERERRRQEVIARGGRW